ncbi:ATP-dependent DNA/RNA helicase DHX36 isoform X2 [Folsomia candida]|uniref:ATP-dependent DNA/RNA helicase DHX36 isoform X2 n=1 Tax=Folsomia candida TaxID=158441 RepID=UPI001604B65E|nr:ATP-dependent DNA/RNA helicase DHX36 isoform X2 [Folsomia candida]
MLTLFRRTLRNVSAASVMNRRGDGGGGGSHRLYNRGRGRGRRVGSTPSTSDRREAAVDDAPRERPPPHLKGRDIGLWYARQQGTKAKEEEILGAMDIEVNHSMTRHLTSLISAFDKSVQGFGGSSSSDSSCSFSVLLDDINNPKPQPEGIIIPCQLTRDESKDQMMLEDLHRFQSTRQFQNLLCFRERLPASKCKEEIIQSIAANQVVVISGETGCGKTTQIGQYILDDMIMQRKGSVCNILCTQPRRISAVSVAERVAEERCERVGGKSVGYVIRLESKRPKRDEGAITFCTTGVVFKYLKDDPHLTRYSHLIIDEVHERDTNSDILIGVLRDLIKVRPDLKVVLMSATINATHFSTYFGECPMFNIPGLTFPVHEYYLEDIIEQLNFKFEIDEDACGPFSNYTPYFSDKEYAKYLTDYVRRSLRDRSKYSLATINEILKPESEKFEFLMKLTERLLIKIQELDDSNSAVLIFVTGWDEISKLNKRLIESGKFPENKFLILPLHSMMPTVNQRQIFDRPPPGKRKIIIATNIAETSITIDDVVHVIDFGKIKMTNFDKTRNVETLESEWVSRANAKQRRGRAGRIQEGYCYHLFTKARESTLDDFQKPEVLRKRLEEVILQLKLLKVGDIRSLLRKLLDPPSKHAVDLSFDRLVLLHALNSDEKLTPLGYHLSHLPMHPQTGKMILLGAVFSVVDPVFSIAASLSYKDPFVMPLGKEHVVDNLRKSLAGGSKSDHWAIAEALSGYEKAVARNCERDYCFKNFLSLSTCKLLTDFKQQFCDQLHHMKFLTSNNPKDPERNLNSSNIALVKAVVCAGLYPNIAKVRLKNSRGGGPPFPLLRTKEDGSVYIHKKSVNAQETKFECPFIVYHNKQKLKQIMLFDTTMISPYPLIFFGANLAHKVTKGVSFVEIDGWNRFKISKDGCDTIEALRATLEKILAQKIAHPSPTDWRDCSLEGQLLASIRDLITMQYYQIMNPDDYSDANDPYCW